MMKYISWGAALLLSRVQAGLYVVNPSSLKDQFGEEGEITSTLSNIGFRNFQKGTSRLGQVISPFLQDGKGCQPFDWETDFSAKEMEHFSKQEGFFLLLQRGGCSFS